MNFNWDDPKYKIQQWVIAYKPRDKWVTIRIPGDVKKPSIERVLLDLNKVSGIVYSRQIMGAMEKDNHYTKKGEFIGL